MFNFKNYRRKGELRKLDPIEDRKGEQKKRRGKAQ